MRQSIKTSDLPISTPVPNLTQTKKVVQFKQDLLETPNMQGEQPDLVRSLKESNGFDNNDALQRPTSMNLAKSKTSRL